jgi:hypothetical protein
MNEDHAKAGANEGKSLVKRVITDSEPDKAAQQKEREGFSGETRPESVRIKAKQESGEQNARKVCLDSAHQPAQPAARNAGESEEKGGQQSGVHRRLLGDCPARASLLVNGQSVENKVDSRFLRRAKWK